MNADERICTECSRSLKGRPDKKFCTDACRNTYNNKQNSDQNNYIRNINNILRKNRRILEETIKTGEEISKCARQKLTDKGFDFRYHTHLYTNKNNQIYHFSYDYGYLLLEGDMVLIVKQKQL